jgi:hypothetical protein
VACGRPTGGRGIKRAQLDPLAVPVTAPVGWLLYFAASAGDRGYENSGVNRISGCQLCSGGIF